MKWVKKIKTRIDKLRRKLEIDKLDAFLVTRPENIRYLSGFSGGRDARLLVTSEHNYIFSDARYYEQIAIETEDWELIKGTQFGLDSLANICNNFKRLGFESLDISYDLFQQMKQSFSAELVPLANIIEEYRLIKDESELDRLRCAARAGDAVFQQICQELQSGMSEQYIANRIGWLLREEGCSKESFDTIAVAGENAALPHGQPGSYCLQPGDMLTLDFGGFFHGYAGDMTRTVAIEKAGSRFRDYYLYLLEAQQLGVSLVKAGVSCKEVDQKVRDCLGKYGLGRYFQHGTGHGVGLEVHEAPRLSPSSQEILEENMLVTVEPGIYIPGWGGIRIEDTVIVKNGGCEVITHSDKELLIINGGI